MPIDHKYGRVQIQHGNIGEDEVVVVFRAQDRLLPEVLDFYRDLCEQEGSPEHHLDAITETRTKVVGWQAANATKTPESADLAPADLTEDRSGGDAPGQGAGATAP